MKQPKSVDVVEPTPDHVQPIVDRRSFIRGSLAGCGSNLLQRAARATRGSSRAASIPMTTARSRRRQRSHDRLAADLTAGGIHLSKLWMARTADGGRNSALTPGAHDGMDVVAAKGNQIVLVRNHEQGSGALGTGNTPSTFVAAVAYENAFGRGGTTNLLFDAVTGKWQSSYGRSLQRHRDELRRRTHAVGYRGSRAKKRVCTSPERRTPRLGVRSARLRTCATGQPLTSPWDASRARSVCRRSCNRLSCTKPKTLRPAASTSSSPNQYGNLAAGGTLYAFESRQDRPSFSFSQSRRCGSDHVPGTTWDTEWVASHRRRGRRTAALTTRRSVARAFAASRRLRTTTAARSSGRATSGGTARQGPGLRLRPASRDVDPAVPVDWRRHRQH